MKIARDKTEAAEERKMKVEVLMMTLQSKIDEDRDTMLKAADRLEEVQQQLKKSEIENMNLKETLM